MKRKETNIATLNRSTSELIRVVTSLLMPGIAFTLLKGLKTLKFLNDFKLIFAPEVYVKDATNSIVPVTTMIKSSTFQKSLR